MNTSVPAATLLRRITAADNAAIAEGHPPVSAEYGLTADKGYTVADPNLDELYELYSQPGSAYWVVEQEGGSGWRRRRRAARLQRAGYLRAAENVFYDQRPRPRGWRRSWRCWRWTTPANKGLSAAIWKPPPS